MSNKQKQFRYDTQDNLDAATPAEGEPGWASDTKRFVMGDGSTPGGIPQAAPHLAHEWTEEQKFEAPIVLQAAREIITRTASAADDTINFDALTQGILHYTVDATGAFVLNFRGDGSTTLNSLMTVGQVWTFLFKAEQGGTAYALSDVTVDGSAVEALLWVDGEEPEGEPNSRDEYSISIEKTDDTEFEVEVIKTSFAEAA